MLDMRSLDTTTIGSVLPQLQFNSLYDKILGHDENYFCRLDKQHQAELIIAFKDIDDFDQSFDAQVMIDFKSYKDQFLMVVWTLSDPKNPLGFPISFKRSDEEDMEKLSLFFEQESIWIHYLATENDELVHIYSEAIQLPLEDRQNAIKIYSEMGSAQEGEGNEESPEPKSKDANQLSDQQLLEVGTGYVFDYSALIAKKGSVENAEEKVLSSILQALDMVKHHPRSVVRECSFLIWATERVELLNEENEHRTLEIYVTPMLSELFDVVHDKLEEENPFSTVFLGFSEFIKTVEDMPLNRGAYPLIEYLNGETIFMELNMNFMARMGTLFSLDEPNPYLKEE